MTITAVSAAVSSFSGLQALAVATGWPKALSPLFPLTVDAYAMTATRVWLANSTRSARARRFARWNAIGAIGLSLLGNAVWHLIAARLITPSWPIVVLVGAVPPAILGLLSHLAVLRAQADAVPTGYNHQVAAGAVLPTPTECAVSRPEQDEEDRTQDDIRRSAASPSSQADDLLTAALAADEAHRSQHGKPITRDALRKALRVSTERATELLRKVREHNRHQQIR